MSNAASAVDHRRCISSRSPPTLGHRWTTTSRACARPRTRIAPENDHPLGAYVGTDVRRPRSSSCPRPFGQQSLQTQSGPGDGCSYRAMRGAARSPGESVTLTALSAAGACELTSADPSPPRPEEGRRVHQTGLASDRRKFQRPATSSTDDSARARHLPGLTSSSRWGTPPGRLARRNGQADPTLTNPGLSIARLQSAARPRGLAALSHTSSTTTQYSPRCRRAVAVGPCRAGWDVDVHQALSRSHLRPSVRSRNGRQHYLCPCRACRHRPCARRWNLATCATRPCAALVRARRSPDTPTHALTLPGASAVDNPLDTCRARHVAVARASTGDAERDTGPRNADVGRAPRSPISISRGGSHARSSATRSPGRQRAGSQEKKL
ncbi:hypothetical protein BC628DRAFT_994268 [Trametes gibbosa]|nr:hypothetical protein BC628DRAFT_994268 [Trametes gibbosa]